MLRISVNVAAVVLLGAIAALVWHLSNPPPAPVPTPAPTLPLEPQQIAERIAGAISVQVARYHASHGRFPTSAHFWQALGTLPIHNPINGSADVVAIKLDQDWDTSEVGWVYDEASGTIYPGVVFNSGRAGTRPTSLPS